MTLLSDEWGRNVDSTGKCGTAGGFHVINKLQDQTTTLIDSPEVSYGSGKHNSHDTAF